MYFKKDWNETGVPLAYFITFRTYGSWLHGDMRGSTDQNNNRFGQPFYPPDREWKLFRQEQLKGPPVKLDGRRRNVVSASIQETCTKRTWNLMAKNVRTNHVHVVVDPGSKGPSIALNALKANATRRMREEGLWDYEYSPWARRGSKRRLWNDKDVFEAIDYVLNDQGKDLD